MGGKIVHADTLCAAWLCRDFHTCTFVMGWYVCGLPAHCPQSGDTAVAKAPVTAAKSPSACHNTGNPKLLHLLPPSLPNIVTTSA